MNIDWNTDIYCLIGNPVDNSLSPKIHNHIFNENNANCIYVSFNVEEKDLKTVINSFKALNIKGFNVTIPHKINVINYLDNLTTEAKIMGAVNTVKNLNGKLVGYNTDGIGFAKSLYEEGIKIKGNRFLVLGAGGASYAICKKLAMEGANTIVILNRTLNKAKNLAETIKSEFKETNVYYDFLTNVSHYIDIDVVVNCTSIGMLPDVNQMPVNPLLFKANTIVYDIIYKPLETKFLLTAKERGLKTVNGISMLVNQALLSQNIWLNNDNILKSYEKIKGFLKNM